MISDKNSDLPVVEIFCDGACKGNPGPGGWGTLLRSDGKEKELSGYESNTTNNRMELKACLNGLKSLTKPCRIKITTDSQYLAKAFNNGWLAKWQKNGWRTADKSPVKNKELWEELVAETSKHQVEWLWIKGHAGHSENERCDKLAVEACKAGIEKER
ncbi:MAG: ribonuclease HI [Candidatus Riflebacteria bacterium]|nr:ribonuclease HI [Candidatus Riflebacteria bacterium]